PIDVDAWDEPELRQPGSHESGPEPEPEPEPEVHTPELIVILDSEASTESETEPTELAGASDAPPVELVAQTEDAAEWLDVVDEDNIRSFGDFRGLAEECLAAARKAKDFHSQTRFACLSNFYAFMTRRNATRSKSALRVAQSFVRGPWFARRICADARYFEKNTGRLPPRRIGKKGGARSLLDDEDVMLGVQRWLRTQETGTITPQLLRKHLNEVLLPALGVKRKKSVSVRTAVRWMWKLGYKRRRHRKGVYWDGHERKDVVKARVAYLARMKTLAPHMRAYEGASMEPEPLLQLENDDGEAGDEVIVIYHDESAYHANDFSGDFWLKDGEMVLKKKDQGRLIMVSDFVCKPSGRLFLNEDELQRNKALPAEQQLKATDARIIICPSSKAGGDDYWNMAQMLAQMKDAIAIAKFKWPHAHLVFVFDNSSCHDSMSDDALNVKKMNVNPGGAQRIMHDTYIPSDNPNPALRGKLQRMVYEDDHPDPELCGKAKGMRVVLQERGLIRADGTDSSGKRVIGECKACAARKARKPHLTGPTKDELDADMGDEDDAGSDDDDDAPSCCMQRMLSRQTDFAEEKSELWKLLHANGCECLFLPKFHPELNPIELLWGWSKRYFRERSTRNFKFACALVPESLDACPLSTIRCFFRRVQRYQDVYRLGQTGLIAEYAVKKYKSHRSITQADLSTVTLENQGKSGPGKGWRKGKKRAAE
ncbi:hypothetical protein AURDEDRAFT_75916, partial [Auricularia subglabra TFB-10046 SS5]